MRVARELQACRERDWDRFVEGSPDGTFFHRTGWKRVIEKTFGYKSVYFHVEENGEFAGVLPLFEVPLLPFGKALVSVPFGVYGGIAAPDDDSVLLLVGEARSRLEEAHHRYVEFRQQRRLKQPFPVKELYATFRKEILPTEEENLAAIPRKRRAMIREGRKYGLTGEMGGKEFLGPFYDLYCHSLHNLGTPSLPRSLFSNLLEEFGDDCRILVIRKNEEILSAVMTFFHKDTVMPYYAGAWKWALHMNVYDAMYWELFLFGCRNGYKLFDFGRSKRGTGAFQFKTHWGFEPEDLEYQYCLRNGVAMPDFSPANPKFSLAIEAWKRLPLPVANLLGPRLIRYFP